MIIDKYSNQLNAVVDSIVKKTTESYRESALQEAREEASRILQEAEKRRDALLKSFGQKRQEVLEAVLRQLGL
jgi:hypothetical protein